MFDFCSFVVNNNIWFSIQLSLSSCTKMLKHIYIGCILYIINMCRHPWTSIDALGMAKDWLNVYSKPPSLYKWSMFGERSLVTYNQFNLWWSSFRSNQGYNLSSTTHWQSGKFMISLSRTHFTDPHTCELCMDTYMQICITPVSYTFYTITHTYVLIISYLFFYTRMHHIPLH